MLGFVHVLPASALMSAIGYVGHLVGYFGLPAQSPLLPPAGVRGGGLRAPAREEGEEERRVMAPRERGTCPGPLAGGAAPLPLRWGSDPRLASNLSCHSRDGLAKEWRGYWETTGFLRAAGAALGGTVSFYDSITREKLFVAPRGRSFGDFIAESRSHGWPSFRDEEVVAENVRVLRSGETVSIDGTHLGRNVPDSLGNRYSVNMASISGQPSDEDGGAGDAESYDLEAFRDLLSDSWAATTATTDDDGDFDGYKFRDLIVSHWGRPYDIQIKREVFLGKPMIFFNVMWKFYGQQSFHLTEKEYLEHLQALAELVVRWDRVDRLKSEVRNSRKRPNAYFGYAVALPLDLPGEVMDELNIPEAQ